ncbi:MAG: hypothetical protein IJA45_05845 [Oscillospiraceae bacterium]|nr:hypothetical protein [Oscillospiraceae bacterium]
MFHCQELKRQGENSLRRAAFDPKRLLFIHVGVMMAASLLLTVADYILQLQIGTTGGLSGIATRSMLSTTATVLQLLYLVLTPFWQAGYLTVSLAAARGEQADTACLFSGLRRFGPIARLYLLQGLILSVLFMASNYISNFLYMLTPWGRDMMGQLTQILEQTDGAPSEEALASLAGHGAPMLILTGVILLVIAIPTFYRMRLSLYRIMDGERRALRAILESVALTKGRWFSLVKLDLSFWWFYAGQVIIGLLGYADILLELAGHPLPWSEALRFFVPYAAYLVLLFGFQLWQKNRVAVTYAHAYEILRQPREAKPEPKNLPWEDSFS